MSKGFHRDRQEDIESVVAVQFSIFSPKEIEDRSVVEITSQATYEGSEPKTGGLFDARMGVLDNGKKCLSCGQTNHGCPGHFGHFRLTRPVYYVVSVFDAESSRLTRVSTRIWRSVRERLVGRRSPSYASRFCDVVRRQRVDAEPFSPSRLNAKASQILWHTL